METDAAQQVRACSACGEPVPSGRAVCPACGSLQTTGTAPTASAEEKPDHAMPPGYRPDAPAAPPPVGLPPSVHGSHWDAANEARRKADANRKRNRLLVLLLIAVVLLGVLAAVLIVL